MKADDMSTKCVLCGETIDNNNASGEHVIPNAIGGRLVVKDFICRTCNSTKGNTWDLAVAEYFNPLCIHFKITRDRGIPKHLIIERLNGEKLRKYHDGTLKPDKPVYEIIEQDGKKSVHIEAPTDELFNQMLNRAKKEFPGIDVEKALESVNREPEKLNEVVSFSMASKGSISHSLTKTILAFARHCKLNLSHFDDLIECLKHESISLAFYYKKDLIRDRPKGIFHCVCISNKNQDGVLIGYVEYFSSFRFLFKIADCIPSETQYEYIYAVDPITGTPLNLTVDIKLSRKEIDECILDTSDVSKDIKSALDVVFPLGMTSPFDDVVNQAIIHGFESCGIKKGEYLEQEQYKNFSEIVSLRIVQLLIEQQQKRNQ